MSENSSLPSQTSGSPWSDDDDLTADLDLGFDGAEDILRTWAKGLRPDPDLTVSEWADQHRWLSSRASAEPGRYRTARTPYLPDWIAGSSVMALNSASTAVGAMRILIAESDHYFLSWRIALQENS